MRGGLQGGLLAWILTSIGKEQHPSLPNSTVELTGGVPVVNDVGGEEAVSVRPKLDTDVAVLPRGCDELDMCSTSLCAAQRTGQLLGRMIARWYKGREGSAEAGLCKQSMAQDLCSQTDAIRSARIRRPGAFKRRPRPAMFELKFKLNAAVAR